MTARERLALDAAILAALVLAANPLVTGMGLHEWISITLIAPVFIHLLVNWDWVARVAAGLLGKLRMTSRINLAIDIALFVSTVGVTISGFLVMPGLANAMGLQASGIWHAIHLWTSDLTIGCMVGHLVAHTSWIAEALGRTLDPAKATAERS